MNTAKLAHEACERAYDAIEERTRKGFGFAAIVIRKNSKGEIKMSWESRAFNPFDSDAIQLQEIATICVQGACKAFREYKQNKNV